MECPDAPAAPRILFVLTSHGDLGETGRRTGYYLPEIAHPWAVFRRYGFQMDAVSPGGGRPPMDGVDRTDALQAAFLDDPAAMALVAHTLRPEMVDPAIYAAIFFVGGHGTMWDFPDDARLARLTAAVYQRGGVVAAVCHGPSGLVNVRLADGRYLVADREVAAFTDDEERAVGLSDTVPFLLASKLVERGARHTAAPNFAPHVVVDGRLATGQNPASATALAEAVSEVLASRPVPASVEG